METVADKKTESNKMDRSKPFVKALRLVPDNPNNSRPRMEETNPKEFTIFPRKAWEKMFDKAGNPVLPNFNWKFVESVSNDGSLKQK